MRDNITLEKTTIEYIAMCNGCGKLVGANPVRAVLNGLLLDKIYCSGRCGKKNYPLRHTQLLADEEEFSLSLVYD